MQRNTKRPLRIYRRDTSDGDLGNAEVVTTGVAPCLGYSKLRLFVRAETGAVTSVSIQQKTAQNGVFVQTDLGPDGGAGDISGDFNIVAEHIKVVITNQATVQELEVLATLLPET